MRKILEKTAVLVCIGCCSIFLSGCEDGGGSGSESLPEPHDFGSNDPNTVVAMGDSITALEGGNTTTYPQILASITGKRVINEGRGGATSDDGLSKVQRVLNQHHPGYVLVLYGANDIIRSTGRDNIIENLTSIINAIKNNKSVPIIATLTPMYYSHELFDGATKEINVRIRQLAVELDCDLADLEEAFGTDTSYMLDDGLHPNDAGLNVIAEVFADFL